MKKILLLIAALSVAMLFASCKKDENKKIDDEDAPEAAFVWRGVIERLADAWDFWDFTYNANGTIKKVDRDEGDRVWNWDWAGDGTLQASVNGRDQIAIYRSADGTISSMNIEVDGGTDAYTYTYTNGIMTEAKKNGAVVTTVTVLNGNITKVVDGDNTMEFEYGDENNANGFMLHWLDHQMQSGYPSWRRFLVESGMLGKGPAKCPVSVKINGAGPYAYAYDKPATVNGYDVLGWSIPDVATDEYSREEHKYMQLHK